jgi:uncharacterized protein (DUF3820 family)
LIKLTLPMNPDDLQRLVSMAMPFGKYKGRLLADLPGRAFRLANSAACSR